MKRLFIIETNGVYDDKKLDCALALSGMDYKEITPPSDEEIDDYANKRNPKKMGYEQEYNDGTREGIIIGAEWMRERMGL